MKRIETAMKRRDKDDYSDIRERLINIVCDITFEFTHSSKFSTLYFANQILQLPEIKEALELRTKLKSSCVDSD